MKAYIGHLFIICGLAPFILDYFYDTPSYNTLIHVEGEISKHTVKNHRGTITHWLYLSVGASDSKGGRITLCLPDFPQISNVFKPGYKVWAKAKPSHSCNYQAWELGVNEQLLVPYDKFYEREQRVEKRVKIIGLIMLVVGILVLYVQRRNKRKEDEWSF
jgi:hypothetical protein